MSASGYIFGFTLFTRPNPIPHFPNSNNLLQQMHLSRAKTMRVKPPAPQPPQPEAESRPRVLNRAKSSPNLLLGLDVTPEVSSSRASLLSDSLINLADGERPSKSRRKGSSL